MPKPNEAAIIGGDSINSFLGEMLVELDPSFIDPRYLGAAKSLLSRLEDITAPESIKHVYYHWSVSRYDVTFPDYNINIVLNGGAWSPSYTTSALLNSLEPLRPGYAAHTFMRNGHAVGIAVDCMFGASPSNFGDYAVQIHQLEMMCAAGAAVCTKYAIDAADDAMVMTHAEAAIRDGYFVTDSPSDGQTRWDLARFADSDVRLTKQEAIASGTILRSLTHAYKIALLN